MPEQPMDTDTETEVRRQTLAALEASFEPLNHDWFRSRRLYVSSIIAERLHTFKGASAFVAVNRSLPTGRTPCPSCGGRRTQWIWRIQDVGTGGLVDVCGFCARYLCGLVDIQSVQQART